MLTLEQLRTFLSVARLGGVRRAAEELHISQPAVSARVAGLESALGVTLFQRGPKGVRLTKQGVLLRSHAEQIATSLERIKAEVVPPEAVSSLLRIGVAETIAQTWLPAFLRELNRAFPSVKIEVVVETTVNLREALLARALDLAILMGPISEFSVDNLDLPPFRLAWYRPVAMAAPDLSKVPVISYNRLSRPHRDLNHELQARHGATAQIFPTNSLSTGFEMVAAGIGVGLMPVVLGKRLLKEGRIAAFDPGWLPQDLVFTASYIGEPRDSVVHRAARIAVEVATRHAVDPDGREPCSANPERRGT